MLDKLLLSVYTDDCSFGDSHRGRVSRNGDTPGGGGGPLGGDVPRYATLSGNLCISGGITTCPGPLTTPFPTSRGAITFWGGCVNGAFIRGGGPSLIGGTADLSNGNPPPLGENRWAGGSGGGDDDLPVGIPPSLGGKMRGGGGGDDEGVGLSLRFLLERFMSRGGGGGDGVYLSLRLRSASILGDSRCPLRRDGIFGSHSGGGGGGVSLSLSRRRGGPMSGSQDGGEFLSRGFRRTRSYNLQ